MPDLTSNVYLLDEGEPYGGHGVWYGPDYPGNEVTEEIAARIDAAAPYAAATTGSQDLRTRLDDGLTGVGSLNDGTPVVRRFPFAFNTAGLLTGHAVYTPTVGDLLLDAWFEVTTAWNGTTPKGDFGSFAGGHVGILATRTAVQDMTVADVTTPGGLQHQVTGSVLATTAPGKFTTADPIKVVVSQNGQDNGTSPASTAGAGALYLVTCTPR